MTEAQTANGETGEILKDGQAYLQNMHQKYSNF